MVTEQSRYGYRKLMVSYGGKLQRFSEGGGPQYIGGEHQVVRVSQSISLQELRDRLATAVGCFNIAIQYVRPGEPLDALHDVVTAGDVRDLLDWVLYRDIHIKLLCANPADVPQVRVFVVRVDGRPPLPEALFTPAPSTPVAAPTEAPVSLSSLKRRSASAPSLSTKLPDGTSQPLSPALIHRSVSAPSLSPPSTGDDTTSSTTTTAGSTRANQDVAPNAAMQRSLARPAPVFLVPVAPVIVYQPVIPVYQVFVVRDCAVHRLNQIRCLPISYDMNSITEAAVQGANEALA
ncbi:hypothetical protein VPH35_029063 [Triticum aestivum]|uniref:PB1 domain-containing protein n=1 Tax=Triticum aestivum TaxID=4565 RepID=A0A3B6C8I4_WHEAT|nr:uncharacterized protein LOC123045183 [Triticum aestivum]